MNEKKGGTEFSVLTHTNGTKTLVDSENGQAMHSRVGPVEEARLVYADLARVEERLREASVTRLWDVGMGTAANVIATLARIRSVPSAIGKLEIHSFETKPEGLRGALAAPAEFPWLTEWGNVLGPLLEMGVSNFNIGRVEIQWRLHVGDFYARYPSLSPPDVVYFDFYSPKKVPELWHRSHLAPLRQFIGDHETRLFTYSAATPTRLEFLLSGFFVGKSSGTSLKNETTVAASLWDSLQLPLGSEWLDHKIATSESVANFPDLARLRDHPQWSFS